jgi:hypothetical protein
MGIDFGSRIRQISKTTTVDTKNNIHVFLTFCSLFTDQEINRIKEITIYDIIMAVTKMDADDIPKNPFNVPVSTGD